MVVNFGQCAASNMKTKPVTPDGGSCAISNTYTRRVKLLTHRGCSCRGSGSRRGGCLERRASWVYE